MLTLAASIKRETGFNCEFCAHAALSRLLSREIHLLRNHEIFTTLSRENNVLSSLLLHIYITVTALKRLEHFNEINGLMRLNGVSSPLTLEKVHFDSLNPIHLVLYIIAA